MTGYFIPAERRGFYLAAEYGRYPYVCVMDDYGNLVPTHSGIAAHSLLT